MALGSNLQLLTRQYRTPVPVYLLRIVLRYTKVSPQLCQCLLAAGKLHVLRAGLQNTVCRALEGAASAVGISLYGHSARLTQNSQLVLDGPVQMI